MSTLAQPKEVKRIRRDDPNKCADHWIIYGKNFLICSSDNPAHPQGVWSCEWIDDWRNWNSKLGKPSRWEDLPATLQQVLVNFFSERE